MANETVTISAEYFAELYSKSNYESIESVKKLIEERDKLKFELDQERASKSDEATEKRLAEAEKCINECFEMCNKEWNATAKIANLIRAWRDNQEME